MVHPDTFKLALANCIHFLEVPEVETLMSRFDRTHPRLYEIDATPILADEDLFRDLDNVIHFTVGTPTNVNHLAEAFGAMDERPTPGYLLVIWNSEHFWQSAPRVAATLLETWLFSARVSWTPDQTPFHLIFAW